MTVRKYFEKKKGIVWVILISMLALFAFGGFDLIFKIVYVQSDFQNSALKYFQQLIKTQSLPNFYKSNFFLLIFAFTVIEITGLFIWYLHTKDRLQGLSTLDSCRIASKRCKITFNSIKTSKSPSTSSVHAMIQDLNQATRLLTIFSHFKNMRA